MKTTTLKLRIVSLLLIVFAMANCGQNESVTGTSAAVTATFSSLYTNIFSKACVQCHSPTGSATLTAGTTLNFSTSSLAYSTLTSGTVSGISTSGTCSTVKIVNPSSPTTSYLIAVLISQYNTANFVSVGCTPYATHLQDQSLTSAEQTALYNWISNGALNN